MNDCSVDELINLLNSKQEEEAKNIEIKLQQLRSVKKQGQLSKAKAAAAGLTKGEVLAQVEEYLHDDEDNDGEEGRQDDDQRIERAATYPLSASQAAGVSKCSMPMVSSAHEHLLAEPVAQQRASQMKQLSPSHDTKIA